MRLGLGFSVDYRYAREPEHPATDEPQGALKKLAC